VNLSVQAKKGIQKVISNLSVQAKKGIQKVISSVLMHCMSSGVCVCFRCVHSETVSHTVRAFIFHCLLHMKGLKSFGFKPQGLKKHIQKISFCDAA